jgi:cytochrome b pre-mRNA-processing protein 3
MMLERMFGKSPIRSNAETLYSCAVVQARQPIFYANMGVPDTVDGRFDMIALHVFLILRRLKQDGVASQETSQALFDAMFLDMDRGLRELGAGDLGVGRRVKVMAKAFYGRIAAYDEGLMSDDTRLCDAILRNIFRGDGKERDHASLISVYLRGQADVLEHQSTEAILNGVVQFTLPEIGNDWHNAP